MSERIHDWLTSSYGSYVPSVIERLYVHLNAQLQNHIGEYVLVHETRESLEFENKTFSSPVLSLCPPHWRTYKNEYLSLGIIQPGGLVLSSQVLFEIPTSLFATMKGSQMSAQSRNMQFRTFEFDAAPLQQDEVYQKAIIGARIIKKTIETTFEVIVGDQAVFNWFKEKNRSYHWLDFYRMAVALGRVVWTPELRAAFIQQRKHQPRFGNYAYIICPADHYKPMEVDKIKAYVEDLELRGTMAYWPYRDCPEDDPTGQARLDKKCAAIREADEVHFWWNDYAKDAMAEFGIAYALHKPIVIMNPDAIPRTPRSSINNVCLALAGQ